MPTASSTRCCGDGAASTSASAGPEEIPFLKRQTRLTFARCGIIDPLSLDDYQAHGGLAGLARRIEIGPPRDRRDGDAVRPARPRRRRLPDRHQVEDRRRHHGRPEIHRLQRRRGRQRHLRRPHDDGRRSLHPDRGHGDRRPRDRRDQGLRLYPLRIPACLRGDEGGDRSRRAAAACSAPTCSGSAHAFDMEVRVGAGAYVCGEETSLLESLEGKRGLVRAKPPLPAHQGPVRPADGHQQRHVARLRAVDPRQGRARPIRAYGMGRSRGTMPIQLAGNIKHGGLFETAFGITLGELVEEIGGGTLTGRPVKAVQVGGPLGAYFPQSAVRHAVRLREPSRPEGRADRPWRHRRVRRYRRHEAPGALRHGILRHRELRQVHALPHRLDPRRRDHRQDHRRPGRGAGTSRSSRISARR